METPLITARQAIAKQSAERGISRNEIDQFHTLAITHDCAGAALEFGHFDNGYNGHDIR